MVAGSFWVIVVVVGLIGVMLAVALGFNLTGVGSKESDGVHDR